MTTKAIRKELDALSKEVYGTTSRWQKLINQGYKELVTEEKEETIPPEKEGDEPTTRTVKVPVLKNGSQQYVVKRYDESNIKEHLLEQKKHLDNLREQLKKLQEEQARLRKEEEEKRLAEEQAKALHQQIAGSANKV